jgi:lipopolysaccharide transport system ATP-binding protein
MSQPIIEVKGISKCYQLGAIGATRLRDDVERLWHRVTGKAEEIDKDEFWALRDVSFEVQPGEIIGIIGRNGAGKSTLLKILSRITEPSSGEIVLRGRVASLLEVGTGFVADLSGRDNIFLNGAILGMSRAEIRRNFDEIVAFSEIEQFIDTPVKRYSSGMYVRLAFAVAAHLEPEILIIDEVLAVGDSEFQRKCMKKMDDVSKHGRTVVFVSHSMVAVQALCSSATYLENGKLILKGSVSECVQKYLKPIPRHDGALKVANLDVILDQDGVQTVEPSMERSFVLRAAYQKRLVGAIYLNWIIYTEEFAPVFSTVTWAEAVAPNSRLDSLYQAGCVHSTLEIPPGTLNTGRYFASFLILNHSNVIIERFDHVVSFTIQEESFLRPTSYGGEWIGTQRRAFRWDLTLST